MSIAQVVAVLALIGVVGGLVNCCMVGAFNLPSSADGVWRPGWIGSVVTGLAAAFLVSFGNQPLSAVTTNSVGALPDFPLNFFVTAFLAAIGGSQLLLVYTQKQATELANRQLADTVKNLTP